MAMILRRIVDAAKPPACYLDTADMERIGIGTITRAARFYNTLRHGGQLRYRRQLFRNQFDALIAEQGGLRGSPVTMRDGYAIDTSGTLPFLKELIEESEQYIAERGMRMKGVASRGFIRDILKQEDLARFSSFLNFILSPEVMATVCRYLGYVPVLSTTIPPGVRFVESSADGQEALGVYRHSQFHHLDLHDLPLVYVIVLLRDVTPENGPFTFLPASVSDRAARKLRYHARGSPYRVTDAAMHAVVDRREEVVFAHPRGTVLFIDTSKCFHFGSRDAVVPRYQMMYTLLSPCRTDFTEAYLPPRNFPQSANDSRLRRHVLQRHLKETA